VNNNLYKCFLVFALSMYSVVASSTDMETFFADPKNRKSFEAASKNGMIKKGREQVLTHCVKESKRTKSNEDCGCYKKEMDKLSDEVFFYQSVTAYLEFNERVEARKNNNAQKLALLDKKRAERSGALEEIHEKCKR